MSFRQQSMPAWARPIITQLNRIENLMTASTGDQAHLDADVLAETGVVNALGAELEAEVAALKAQIAAGTPAPALNFTGLDALVASTTAQAAADAPPPASPAAS